MKLKKRNSSNSLLFFFVIPLGILLILILAGCSRKVFRTVYPSLNDDMLEWGNLIYLAGFPAGQFTITKGIFSKAPGHQSNFLTDAHFNEGFSGGIALAVREGVPNFELVGIGQSDSARTEYFLKTEKENYEYRIILKSPLRGNSM